jgi:hypothetical protein
MSRLSGNLVGIVLKTPGETHQKSNPENRQPETNSEQNRKLGCRRIGVVALLEPGRAQPIPGATTDQVDEHEHRNDGDRHGNCPENDNR